MQVNPSPPQADQGARVVGALKGEDKSSGSSGVAHRFDAADRANLSIDGVLLNSHAHAATSQQDQDFNAISAQLQNQYNAHNAHSSHGAHGAHNSRLPTQDTGRFQAAPKPTVGSDEWYKVRKDNHKEVERRRREAINKGIDDLAQVVPDCDKHKGQILGRAVEYIKKLKEQEMQNQEKLTLEKLLSEQAMSKLASQNHKLQTELAQAWKEVEHWKVQALGKK